MLRSGKPQRVERYEDARGDAGRARCSAPATARRWRRRSPSAGGSGARWPRGRGRTSRCPRTSSSACATSPTWSRSALANADAHEQLAASRARIVEVGDAERRRLERNLHDGAQQRLVSVALDLRMVGATLEKDPAAARKTLAAAQEQLAKGLEELRELARGIHPAVLTERGLGPALQGLLARAPVPVEITELPEERLAGPVEAAAYYVVAEAITNVAKYAHASYVTVSIRRSNGSATVVVTDDGVGGADPALGTGLRGLADRLEALDGALEVDSPTARGTRISAEIPSL